MTQPAFLASLLFVAAFSLSARAAELDDAVKSLDRDRVVKQADEYLKQSPTPITDFHAERSAGGPHDYFSEGDYWWPDPKNPAGPYIQRDGMTNPDNFVAHRHAMMQMSIQSCALAAAYKLTGEQKYADHAVAHWHAWFVDERTRMNPNLQYAQAIKGVSTGRGIGIIDTLHLVEVTRAIEAMEKRGAIKSEDAAAIKKWFADYLAWMTTSKNGKDEMNAKNNHGTCWAAQVAAFATLVGDREKLEFCRKRFKEVLLPNQLARDGSFPQELRRTKPYGYSLFNLDAMTTVAELLSTPDENLWEYSLPGGESLHTAVEFMYPYIRDKSKWPHQPDVMFWEFWPVRCPSLLFASRAYREPKYFDLWKTLEASPTNEEVLRNLPIRQPVLWVD